MSQGAAKVTMPAEQNQTIAEIVDPDTGEITTG